ncbi:MAG: hypothetical protein QOD66_2214 [Solirubrobacteraceae bacterium]|nr:hypothetical protein [Solirubrobacteraceae bacterium]
MVEIRDEEPQDETVQEAAEHAERAGEHRQEMQRRAAQAEASGPADAAELEREAADHGTAAQAEESMAGERAREADEQAER